MIFGITEQEFLKALFYASCIGLGFAICKVVDYYKDLKKEKHDANSQKSEEDGE